MEHFADHAPQDIRQALKELANYAGGEINNFKNSEAFGEYKVSEIWGKDPGGFIPFQLGGFEANTLIRHDTDLSYHLTESMTQEADRRQKDCEESFLQDIGKASFEELTEEEREGLYNSECEWHEPALLRFECWLAGEPYPVSEAEKELGKVILRLSVNTDAPYYRTRYDDTLHELSLSVDALREAVKRWPDDWQERLWRELLKNNTNSIEGA